MASQYSEKLAYMPYTYFVGDHKQMFPHLKERLIVSDKNGQNLADNVAIINATDLSPLVENTDVKEIREVVKAAKPVEISLKVAELPTTTPIENMIASGQVQTSLNGVLVQNGLATTQTNNKAATGEEVILITCYAVLIKCFYFFNSLRGYWFYVLVFKVLIFFHIIAFW